jgi:hypothetical protein
VLTARPRASVAERFRLPSWRQHVTERQPVNKPARKYPQRLGDLLDRCLGETFAQQGFASTAIVTHWREIVGAEIAALCEPIKLQWPRGELDDQEPATLVLRVEGPAAIEIQHQGDVILERINRFFGWRAVGRIAIRQAPLAHAGGEEQHPPADPKTREDVAAAVSGVADDGLRAALARLGAAIKRP